MAKNKTSFLKKLKHKYRLVVFNEDSYKEVWWIKLSRLKLINIFTIFTIVLVTIIILSIAYTPLKEYIPGYPSGEIKKDIILNAIKVDSLEQALKIKDQYFNNLKKIIKGEKLNNYVDYNKNTHTDSIYKVDLNHKLTVDDSLLRIKIEREETYNVSPYEITKTSNNLSDIHFFPPLKGIITNKFDKKNHHYGVDIVSQANEPITAVLKGRVIFTGWTLKTGYVIQIQHDNNLVSIYKHLDNLIVEEGDKVNTADPIAFIGNTGEETTGPHLHFELWHNGNALNPEDYINF